MFEDECFWWLSQNPETKKGFPVMAITNTTTATTRQKTTGNKFWIIRNRETSWLEKQRKYFSRQQIYTSADRGQT